jgi:nitrate ABC transporter permease subunit
MAVQDTSPPSSILPDAPLSATPPAKPGARAWVVLAMLCFVYVLNFLDRQLLSILAKPIQDTLNISDSQLGLIGGLYFAFFYCFIAIPVGFLIGMSPLMYRALDPFIQILRPISPLAWMPLALFILKDSEVSSVFVIFICSIWPMLINTAFGVSSVKRDYLNVARTHELGWLRTALLVVLPAAAPTILTGMRISIGIAWLVIVAAEMLVGGTGIGYYVWNEWNNLDLTSVVFSILMIGVVGMALDAILGKATTLVQYTE